MNDMKKKALLIAEKPSLRKVIQEVYEKHKDEIPYSITFLDQAGHLLELKMPGEINEKYKKWLWDTLPFSIEDLGGWEYAPVENKGSGNFISAKERLAIIKKEYETGKYDFIIHAGDPDQEGQVLIWETLDYIGCKIPVFRFWTNDLNEKHVLSALKNLRDEEKDDSLKNLRRAGLCRQHADYLTGMNMSRAATKKMVAPGAKMAVAVGRVMTAILKFVVSRENEIRNFKPTTVYGIQDDYEKGFTGKLFSPKNVSGNDDSDDAKTGIIWFENKKDAQDMIKKLGDKGVVKSCEKRLVTTNPPKLFMLASAQIEAGKMGFKADETLRIIQELYEKKYVTYPRTDCDVLSSDDDFRGILKAVSGIDEYKKYASAVTSDDIARVKRTKKWVDDKKMQSSGHSALRPTVTAPDMSKLTGDQRKIYDMICRRFISIFMPPLKQNETVIVVDVDGHSFISKGKTLVDKGYTEIYGSSISDSALPVVEKDEVLGISRYEITEKTSKCPSRFTSATLIAACESPQKFIVDENLKKITKELKVGTQATRASIINKLIALRYIEETKEQKSTYLKPTETGEMIIDNLKDSMICRVDMTAEWEEKLEKVRAGTLSMEEFETDIQQNINLMVEQIKDSVETKTVGTAPAAVELGTCPICKKGTIKVSPKGYYCTNIKDKSCKFWIGNPLINKKITETQVRQLIKTGKTPLIKGFETEKEVNGKIEKKKFDAYLVVKDGKISFGFEDKKPVMSGVQCPKCGKPLRKMDWGWGCSGYPSCRLALGKISGRMLTEKEVAALVDGQEVRIKGLVSKTTKKKYDATIKLDDDYRYKFL